MSPPLAPCKIRGIPSRICALTTWIWVSFVRDLLWFHTCDVSHHVTKLEAFMAESHNSGKIRRFTLKLTGKNASNVNFLFSAWLRKHLEAFPEMECSSRQLPSNLFSFKSHVNICPSRFVSICKNSPYSRLNCRNNGTTYNKFFINITSHCVASINFSVYFCHSFVKVHAWSLLSDSTFN